MTLMSDGQRLALLQRRTTWVEPDEVPSSRPHSTFLHSWRTTTTTDMWRMYVCERECRGEPVPQDTQSLTGVVGDSRDSAVSMYVCRLQTNHANRCDQWAFARVRLLEHEQPDCQRESPRARWLLMSFWCHSLLSSSLFRARKYIHVC